MKKLLILALAIAFLAAFTGLAAAQQKGEQKNQPTSVEKKQPATGKKTVDKASPKLMTGKVAGKVTGVDPTAKTFTAMIQDKAVTYNVKNLKSLPKVGDIIYIAVGDAGGGCTDWYDQHHKLHHCTN